MSRHHASEPLQIFDPRRNFHVQGFSGRAATTTLHDATATGVSISGIFQTAEDFAVLGLWNAYDNFNRLRLKHLPRTDLSGLKLEFDNCDLIASPIPCQGGTARQHAFTVPAFATRREPARYRAPPPGTSTSAAPDRAHSRPCRRKPDTGRRLPR